MVTEDQKQARGRPRVAPVEGKKYSVSTKLSAETRLRLEQAANRNGHSLGQEAANRVRQSLLDDDQYGGTSTAMLFRMLAGVIWVIESETKKPWREDYLTAVAVEAAVTKALRVLLPPPPNDEIAELPNLDVLDRPNVKMDADTAEKVRQHERAVDRAYQLGSALALAKVSALDAKAARRS
jgi:hypothetical protein